MTKSATAALTVPLLTPWMPGPHDPADAPVVVSVTEFTSQQRRALGGIAFNGLRMREGWYAMPGAVGLWLWSLPATPRSGSISVWRNEDDLERFVSLPHHVDIMKHYGSRGSVRSTKWHAQQFQARVTVERARAWIAGAGGITDGIGPRSFDGGRQRLLQRRPGRA